jgi:hypothetical protein
MVGFMDGYDEARKKRQGFVAAGKAAQGRAPMNSLGYQAGNIANQVTPGKYNAGATLERARGRAASVEGKIKRGFDAVRKLPETWGGNLKAPTGAIAERYGRLYPDNDSTVVSRTYAENENPAVVLRDKINGQRLDNPSNSRPNMVQSGRFSGGGNNDNSATYGPGRIKFTNADFNADGTLTRGAKDKAFLIRDRDRRNMAPPDPNSPVRVGNMDVQFSPSVSKEARARFMQDPVRPTAQINRFRARQRVVPQEERIAMPQVPDLDSISDPAARRFAVREYQLAMDQFKANEEAMTGRRTTANDTMRAVSDAGRFGLEGRRFQAEQDTAAQERQDRQPQIDLERQMRGLEAELLDPNTTPERRKQIQEMRKSLAGPQEDKFRPVTETIYDENGNPVQQVTNAFSERTGEMRGGQQGGRNLPNDRTKWEVNVPYRAPNGQWVYFDGEGLLPYTGE